MKLIQSNKITIQNSLMATLNRDKQKIYVDYKIPHQGYLT